jgi:hypothetical protein
VIGGCLIDSCDGEISPGSLHSAALPADTAGREKRRAAPVGMTEKMCRTYGAFVLWAAYPALARWANLWRASGAAAQEERVCEFARKSAIG